MVILCYLLTKQGPNIGYIKRIHQDCKDYGLFELEEKYLICQVKRIFKTGKLSKVEVEGLIR